MKKDYTLFINHNNYKPVHFTGTETELKEFCKDLIGCDSNGYGIIKHITVVIPETIK